MPGPRGFGVVVDASDIAAIAVRCSPQIRTKRIVSSNGQVLASLYGFVVEKWAHSALRIGQDDIVWGGCPTQLHAFNREVVDGLNGAFVLITEGPLPSRLYMDSGGQIPVVYDPAAKRAGSSPNDILDNDEYCDRFIAQRVERLITREGGRGWIPGTLTAHRGVHRLLPNHYLDLRDFSAHRHWPALDFVHHFSVEQAAESVAADLRGFIRAVAAQVSIAGTLTAGFDTRVLLASSRDLVSQMQFVTFTDEAPGLDQLRATELASLLGLDHRLLPIIDANEAQQRHWDRLVGHAVREVNRRIHPTLGSVPADLVLTGLYGVSGRSVPYKLDYPVIDQKRANARNILTRLALPAVAEVVADVEAWLRPIAGLPHSVVLDLAYNELRFGSWAMGQSPAQKAVKMTLAPMAQRSVLHAFMAVPPAEKQTTRLFTMIARANWPETMDLPVNKFGDWRDKRMVLKKTLSMHTLRRILRKRSAGLLT